jgi:hypothetical protein
MSIPSSQKTPLELLVEQTNLLEKQSNRLQTIEMDLQKIIEIQKQGNEILVTWMKGLIERQDQQSKALRNISSAASLFGIIVILAIIGYFLTMCR